MATTPEGKVKARVIKQLKEAGVYYFMPATGGFGRSGVPDIIGCVDSVFFGIECKAGKNKPTALQDKEMGRISDAGGRVKVINEDNMNEVSEWLRVIATRE